MNQGAREANDESRHHSEAQHRKRVIELLTEIRDMTRLTAEYHLGRRLRADEQERSE
jgi:hypothetical protein